MEGALSRTYVVTDGMQATTSGVSGTATFDNTKPALHMEVMASATPIEKQIIPEKLSMFIVGTAPAGAVKIYLIKDTKLRHSSGGTRITPVTGIASATGVGKAPNDALIFRMSKPGSQITLNASTTDKLVQTILLPGGTEGLGFDFHFDDNFTIQKSSSLGVFVVAAGGVNVRITLWYREEPTGDN
jgi:hypothetical protein